MSTGLKRWKPYPAYKDSGVVWLGQVPEGWEVKRLKFISPQITVGIVVNPSNYVSKEGLPYIYGGDIKEGYIDLQLSRKITDEDSRANVKTLLHEGDLVTVRVGYPGITSVVPKECEGGNCASVMLTRKGAFCSQWLSYVMNSSLIRYQIAIVKYGAAQEQFNIAHATEFFTFFPNIPEQRAITAFLDQQCAQIDSLIEKKQRMLDLLDEKRRAVITQAVTRGLDPTVPMKDSGVEWLGKVPEGWKVGRVAFGYDIALGKMLQPTPNSEQDVAVPYYRAMNVQWESIDSDLKVMWATPEEIKTFSVRQGDLLVCEGGEVGRAAIINLPVDEPTIIQNALHRVRAFKDCHVGYLLRVLEHVSSVDWFSVLCNKSTIAHFTGEKFKALKCPLPPLPEQQAIADYLDAQCAAMDSQRKNLEKSIELLREYRASLITHAVTGKIDVRDVAPLQ